MDINISSIIRSVAVGATVLPISLAIAGAIGQTRTIANDAFYDPKQEKIDEIKTELLLPCLKFAVSEVDSKMEKKAKKAIDAYFEDKGSDYSKVCNWVL